MSEVNCKESLVREILVKNIHIDFHANMSNDTDFIDKGCLTG